MMPSEGLSIEDGTEETLECPVCLMDKAKGHFPEVSTCHHRCCSQCLSDYFRIEIMESRVAIACPECSELFHPNDIEAIVEDSLLMAKYQDFMMRRVLAMDSDVRWCPAPDCTFAVIATGCTGCSKLKCEREGCGTYFCYHCKQLWHPNQTCDAARAERSPLIWRSSSVMKPCPRCGAFIDKVDDGSCNHMTCALCGASFCWLCMKEVNKNHWIGLSGCTYWGRKPWSRKKRILFKLGTLLGAPLGIMLLVVIAVPVIIIGIPVKVGRRVHFRYEEATKCTKNMATTGAVCVSMLVAPVVAVLTVGIGVPILLVYAYVVVPISMCRSEERKPWSRKQRILWQIASLMGAPLEIILAAVIAVPVMIIGIPVLVGRRVQIRYDTATTCKRNMATTGAVCVSVLVAPVVAVITVGIGVPIMLVYVCVVVPVTMCRNGCREPDVEKWADNNAHRWSKAEV